MSPKTERVEDIEITRQILRHPGGFSPHIEFSADHGDSIAMDSGVWDTEAQAEAECKTQLRSLRAAIDRLLRD